MNNAGTRITLTVGLLALALGMSPARAETYIVEPITEPASAQASEQGFTQAELDQMLAPIALYPDALLSQVLIAATYPLEIVEAARWSRQNPQLSGEDAVAAVADREWDPSVKSLVAFPDLLARMDEDLEWTRGLGDAMLFQETQVMDSIQFLRARADATGNLESTEYVKVIREEKTIVIEPAQTRIVHVPYYDPYVVYGTWWWPAYRPIVWAPPAYYYGYGGYPGYYWGTGIHISTGFFYSSFYWPQRSVVIINAPRYYTPPRYWSSRPYYRPHRYYTPGQKWKHNPIHRRGVAYRQPEVRERYAVYNPGSRSVSTGTFSGTQRPRNDGVAAGGGSRDARGSGREWTRDTQRSGTRDRAAVLPEDQDRSRTERTEPRFTQRGTSPAGRLPDAAAQRGTRPDAANLERRLGTVRSTGNGARGEQQLQRERGAIETRNHTFGGSERSAATGRSNAQALRPQASQRAAPAVRSPQVAQRSRTPVRTPQVTTRPQASQRATAPSRTPQVTSRPQASQRSAVPAPTRQASPPRATTSRSAPAPQAQPRRAPAPKAAPSSQPASRATNSGRANSGGSRGNSARGNGGARDSRSGR
jgi:hypothetical protein